MTPMIESHQEISLPTQCQELIEKLDRATNLPAREVEQEVDQIQRDMVRLRDHLIGELRRKDASPVTGRPHSGLEGVNVALALIVGVEYPVTAIKRRLLEQARHILKKIMDEGRLSTDSALGQA